MRVLRVQERGHRKIRAYSSRDRLELMEELLERHHLDGFSFLDDELVAG